MPDIFDLDFNQDNNEDNKNVKNEEDIWNLDFESNEPKHPRLNSRQVNNFTNNENNKDKEGNFVTKNLKAGRLDMASGLLGFAEMESNIEETTDSGIMTESVNEMPGIEEADNYNEKTFSNDEEIINYEEKADEIKKRAQEIAPIMEGNIVSSIKEKDFKKAGKQLAGGILRTAPQTLGLIGASIVGGPLGGTAGLGSFYVTGSGNKYLGLKDREDMSENKKQNIARVNGALEVASEYLGTFTNIDKLLANPAIREATEKSLKSALKNTVSNVYEFGGREFLEEGTNEVVAGLIDKFAGVNPNLKATDIISQGISSGLVGLGMGGTMGAVNQLSNTIRRKNNTEVMKNLDSLSKVTGLSVNEVAREINEQAPEGQKPIDISQLPNLEQAEPIADTEQSINQPSQTNEEGPINIEENLEQTNQTEDIELTTVNSSIPITEMNETQLSNLQNHLANKLNRTKKAQQEPAETEISVNQPDKTGKAPIPGMVENIQQDLNKVNQYINNIGTETGQEQIQTEQATDTTSRQETSQNEVIDIPIERIYPHHDADINKVTEYINKYKENEDYPPIKASEVIITQEDVGDKYYIGDEIWKTITQEDVGNKYYSVEDGMHRLATLDRLGEDTVKIEVPSEESITNLSNNTFAQNFIEKAKKDKVENVPDELQPYIQNVEKAGDLKFGVLGPNNNTKIYDNLQDAINIADLTKNKIKNEKVDIEQQSEQTVEKFPDIEPVDRGKTTNVVTPDNTEVEVQFEVVDRNQLIPSHDELLRENSQFPQEAQPRNRAKVATEDQVQNIYNNLDPERLAENRLAAHGAPIIGADGAVEVGNARVIALNRSYNDNTQQIQNYKEWLIDNAERVGLNTGNVRQIGEQVIVRERTGDIDRQTFTEEANKDGKIEKVDIKVDSVSLKNN